MWINKLGSGNTNFDRVKRHRTKRINFIIYILFTEFMIHKSGVLVA